MIKPPACLGAGGFCGRGRDAALRRHARAKSRAQRTLARHAFWHAQTAALTLRWAMVTAQRAVLPCRSLEQGLVPVTQDLKLRLVADGFGQFKLVFERREKGITGHFAFNEG